VIQLPSAPIEAVRSAIRFGIFLLEQLE